MANKITQDQIIEINILYEKYHNYSKTAREIGVSPGTVKKYIIPDFVNPDTIEIKKFSGPLPKFNPDEMPKTNWMNWILLSDEEENEIKELWKELAI